jgi:hypothetical protein
LDHIRGSRNESFRLRRPQVQRILRRRTESSSGVRLWILNQGFCNLFRAVGALTGVVIWLSDRSTIGRTLITFSCGVMALAGLVLFGSDRWLWRGGKPVRSCRRRGRRHRYDLILGSPRTPPRQPERDNHFAQDVTRAGLLPNQPRSFTILRAGR